MGGSENRWNPMEPYELMPYSAELTIYNGFVHRIRISEYLPIIDSLEVINLLQFLLLIFTVLDK